MLACGVAHVTEAPTDTRFIGRVHRGSYRCSAGDSHSDTASCAILGKHRRQSQLRNAGHLPYRSADADAGNEFEVLLRLGSSRDHLGLIGILDLATDIGVGNILSRSVRCVTGCVLFDFQPVLAIRLLHWHMLRLDVVRRSLDYFWPPGSLPEKLTADTTFGRLGPGSCFSHAWSTSVANNY